MDVSIAVSLIRGQMGAVVERAVNVAVETVLAEMLKVVGVKFEELKAQVKTLRRDAAALQAEKTLKEKENDKMRAALRLAEAKLSYYQRAVELHVQHRAAANASGRTHRTSGEAPPRTTQESLSSDDWSVSLQHTEAAPQLAPPHTQASPPASGSVSAPPPLSPDGSPQADSSTLPCAQVKQEEAQQQEEEEEVICIKEEPEEEQQVVATLLLDCHLQQSQLQAAQGSVADWSEFPVQRNLPDASTHTPSYSLQQPVPALPVVPAGVCARQAVRPWTKDLSLYEEYKLRRNELRRRSLSRRREMEKTLPQPLLADLVRERREKTRLRVARWRAKRKLQACLQQQAPGGAAALSQSVCPISSQQQLRASSGLASGVQQRPCSSFLLSSSSSSLPFIPPSSPPSSSSLLLGAHSVAEHVTQHAVTSSCSSYPQVSLSQQSLSLTDAELFQ